MTHEVRYHDRLVASFASALEAEAYKQQRLAHPVEGPAFDAKKLVVATARRVRLVCRGNLVDTFATEAEALECRAALIAENQAMLTRLGQAQLAITERDFDVEAPPRAPK